MHQSTFSYFFLPLCLSKLSYPSLNLSFPCVSLHCLSLVLTFLFPIYLTLFLLGGFLQWLAPSFSLTLSFASMFSQSLALSFPFSTTSYLLVLQFIWSDHWRMTPHYLSTMSYPSLLYLSIIFFTTGTSLYIVFTFLSPLCFYNILPFLSPLSLYNILPVGSVVSARWSVPSDSPLSRRPFLWIMALCLTALLADDSWGETV